MRRIGENPGRIRILVVEDEMITAKLLKGLLSANGYTVCGTAADAATALKIAATAKPDLVLMEISLGGAVDCVAIAEEIYVCHGVPVLFVCASDAAETLMRTRKTCTYGFIIKPCSGAMLRSAVEIARAKHDELSQVGSSCEWHQKILSELGIAVLATDRDGSARFISAAARDLVAWPALFVAGQPAKDVLRLICEPPWNKRLLCEIKAQKPIAFSGCEILGLDGNRLRVDITISSGRVSTGSDGILLWTLKRASATARRRRRSTNHPSGYEPGEGLIEEGENT